MKFFRKIQVFVLLTVLNCCLFAVPNVEAQQNDRKLLSLDESIRVARIQHPMIIAAQRRVVIAEADILDAGLKHNPILTISGENFPLGPTEQGFNFGSSIDWFATISQTFETGGKRQLRMALADRVLEAARSEATAVDRQVIYDLKAAYEMVVIRRLRATLLQENLDNLNQLVNLNEIRVREGYTAEGDLIKVSLEAQRFAFDTRKANLDYEMAKIELLKAMGAANFEDADLNYDVIEDLDSQPMIFDSAQLRESSKNLPQVRASASRLDQARALLKLEEARIRPDITASLGYKRNGPDNALFAGVNIPLQLYNRNQARVERARAGVELAEAEFRQVQLEVHSELAEARRAVEFHRRQVEMMRTGFLMSADESRSISLAAYREGAVDLLVLIDSQRVRSQAQDLYYQSLYDYKMAIHRLERAVGIDNLRTMSQPVRKEADEN